MLPPVTLAGLAHIAACDNPQPPGLCGSIPQQTLFVSEAVTVTACFDDPNGDVLNYRVWSSDPGVATAAASGSTITVTAVTPGTTLVTILADDLTGLKAQQSFRVLVPNRMPVTVGTPPAHEIEVGDSVRVDMSGYFSDPDGQQLSYDAQADTGVVAVSVAGAAVTVVAVAKGMTAVTVTATDPGGMSAVQGFPVTVPNRPPVAEGTVPAQIVEVGDTVVLNMSGYFSDPDGDPLTYAARASDSSVVAVVVEGDSVAVVAMAKGEIMVTVTASDDEGLAANQSFGVKVPNRPPLATGTIPARTIEVGHTATVRAAPYFSDPDGDALTYTVESSDTSVVSVRVSGDSLSVSARSKGEAVVVVVATDPEGLAASQEFAVTVPNRPPVVVSIIPARIVEVGHTATVRVAPFFSDPDGDPLIYRAASWDPSVAAVTVAGDSVTVAGVAKGETTVTVAARDPEGMEATQRFVVTVPNRAPVPVGVIPAMRLMTGSTTRFAAAPHFNDPDGDPLRFKATSANAQVATAVVSGRMVVVTAVASGTTTITVTGSDPEGLSASQEVGVTVTDPNRPPEVIGSVSDRTIAPGESIQIDADRLFRDPEGGTLNFTAKSADAAVAGVSTSGSVVTVTGVAVGTALVTISAENSGGLGASLAFRVTVESSGGGGGNRGPQVVRQVSSLTMRVGGGFSRNLADHFSDPDGDALEYDASSSDDGVAGVSVSGSVMTVTALGEGTASVTATARDPGGLTASLGFGVTVEADGGGGSNRAPVVASEVSSQTLTVGDDASWELADHFSDPDDDALEYGASSTDDGVATAELSGSVMTVTAVGQGTASVTATAMDPEGLVAALSFSVTVEPAVNQAPIVVEAPSDDTVAVGKDFGNPMFSVFKDPEGLPMEYGAASSNPDVASAQILRFVFLPAVYDVNGLSEGETTVTLTATDQGGLSAEVSFKVTVLALTNQPPVVSQEIQDQTIEVGQERGWSNLYDYFSDPDDATLNFTVTSSDSAIVQAGRFGFFGGFIGGKSVGTATVTFTASDQEGLSVSQDITVTVVDSSGSR